MVARLRPDLVTMDIHMPKLDGLARDREDHGVSRRPRFWSCRPRCEARAWAARSTRLRWARSKSSRSPSRATGPISSGSAEKSSARSRCSRTSASSPTSVGVATSREAHAARVDGVAGGRSIVAIGSSTGGPSALLAVLGRLPKDLKVPVARRPAHRRRVRPGARRLAQRGLLRSRSRSARTVLRPEPGVAYFAPTGANMVIESGIIRFREPGKGPALHPERRHAVRVGRPLLRQAVGRGAAHRVWGRTVQRA